MTNLISLSPNLAPNRTLMLALAERERRRRSQQQHMRAAGVVPFLRRTQIEVVRGDDVALAPFVVWPAQRAVLATMQRERLIVFLKARQLGISWIACGFALWLCSLHPGKPVLAFSQGQIEANELIRRAALLYHQHADRALLPALVTDNTQELAWANGSRMLSLAATRRAGRSFTAALVILDEYAFMQWGPEVLAAVKPTIDAGGQLFIISSADGHGSAYHQLWNAAQAGTNGYTPVFLPWTAHPERGPDWREQKLREAGGAAASVLREYPRTPEEAFIAATGLVYDQWSAANVTEAAAYVPDAGPVLWAVDDGYSGRLDPKTGAYTPDSHPRVFLLVQVRGDGRLCIFAESYAVQTLSDAHLDAVQALPYPAPEYAVCDSSAAELRGRLHERGISTLPATHPVEEGVKVVQRMLAPDANGWRRVLVHPRCQHLRAELASYRRKPDGTMLKQWDHGPDCVRYLCWTQRYD